MIRFSTPIYSKNGNLIGVGVINYLGIRILDSIDNYNIHKNGYLYLLNNDGYYLKGNNINTEWSFMFPEEEQFLFSNELPKIWDSMHKTKQGKASNSQGYYYFSRFYLSTTSPSYVINDESIFLVIHIPNSAIYEEEKTLIYGLIIAWLLIFPIAFFWAYKRVKSCTEQSKL